MKYLFILGPDGQPEHVEDVLVWARWFTTAKRDIDGSPWVSADAKISTVFLSINASVTAVVLWETRVFGGPYDGYQHHYTTEAAACAGHAQAILLITEGKLPFGESASE